MTNQAKTLSELYAELQHKTIAERAEDIFRKKEVGRRRFSQRLANLIPLFTVIVWLVAYSLSAPHTSTLFMRITPEIQIYFFSWSLTATWVIGNVAPLAIEGGVALLSGLTEYGQKQWRPLLFLILTLSVSVNIVGGLVVLNEYLASTDVSHLETAWQLVSVFAGIIVSLVSYATGKIIVMFATDKIDLEIETGKGWFGKVKFYALREAFYNEALKHGATPTRASKYAETMAGQYCEGEIAVMSDGTIQVISQDALIAPSVMSGAMASVDNFPLPGTVRNVPNDFGFAGMVQGRAAVLNPKDTSPNMDNGTVPKMSRITKQFMLEWIPSNDWQILAIGQTKRARSKALSMALTGDEKGYKTIERAFQELGIEL